jgi:hypothetical protein
MPNISIPDYYYSSIPLWNLLTPENQHTIVIWQERHYPGHKLNIQDQKVDILPFNPDKEMRQKPTLSREAMK